MCGSGAVVGRCAEALITHSYTHRHRRVFSKCFTLFWRETWRWEQGQGPLHRELGVLGKGRFHRNLVPCPSQALCNLAVGKAGLTTLWLALIAPLRLSQRDRLQSRSTRAVLAVTLASAMAQRTSCSCSLPLQLSWVHCCSSRAPHLSSCTARLCCCSAGQRDTYLRFTRISFAKTCLQRDSQYAWALAAPQGLASSCRPCALAASLLQPWCQDACSPTGSWARGPNKPVRTLAATSPAAYCLGLLWETLHLRDWQSSPEHAPVTCRKDLDYSSPAGCTAQASWPSANAVDFAYWSIFFLSKRTFIWDSCSEINLCCTSECIIIAPMLPWI